MPNGVEDVVEIVRIEFLVPPPERVMLVGLSDVVRPDGELDVSETVPAKLLRLVTLIVD